MLSLPIDPALILAPPLRPLHGQVALDVLLAQGEAVQATVLDVQDDGSLLILIKGVALPASSLVGRFPVGAVLEAHVESREGQILLRLDQPVQSHGIPALPGDLTPASGPFVESTTGPIRIAALLKTLLPADEPLAVGLARLSGSLSEAVAQSLVSPEAAAEFEALHKQVLIEGRPDGQPLSGIRVQEALRSLGLEHEHRLLTTWQATGGLGDLAAKPTLKGWLMAMLARTAPQLPSGGAGAPGPPAPISAEPSLPQAATSAATQTSLGGVVVGGVIEEGETPEASGGQAAGRPAISAREDRQAAGSGGSVSGSVQLERSLVRNEAPLSTHEVVVNETVVERKEISKDPSSGPVLAHDQAIKEGSRTGGTVAGQQMEEGSDQGPRMPTAQSARPASPVLTAISGSSVTTGTKWGGPIGSLGVTEAAESQAVLHDPRPAGASGSEGSAWVKDLQQVLTILERTQALSSLNSQAGQPILLELPLAWGGEARARLYVESRETGGQGTQQPRPYSVVTLLELDGIGGVRVDTLVTGRHISARFLMDQPEVERAVATMLPALTQSLSAKGYHVDVLTSGTAESRQVRGEDLRARSTPRVSLVNVRV